jgi:hypothetical protein
VFSVGSTQRLHNEDPRPAELITERELRVSSSSSARKTGKRWRYSYLIVGSWKSWQEFCSGDCDKSTRAREAKESPLLEAVVRERLLKTQQTGKRFRVGCS